VLYLHLSYELPCRSCSVTTFSRYSLPSLVSYLVQPHRHYSILFSTFHTFFVSTPARKTQAINLSLDFFSFVSFLAATVSTRVPHCDSVSSIHDVCWFNMITCTKRTRGTENPDAFIRLNMRIMRVAHFSFIIHLERQLCIVNRGYAIVTKQK
jgi:hypothetical protein